MQTQFWLTYAALTALWLAIPGRPCFLVASYAQGKGRVSALFTVPAYGLAQAAAVIAAGNLALGAGLLSPVALSAVTWIGGAALALMIGGIALAPEIVGPFADNDNLREKRLIRAFLDVFAQTFFERRTLFFHVAVAPHFVNAARAWQPQIAWLIVASALAACIAAACPAMASGFYLRRIRSRSRLRRKASRGGVVSIASGAVTAGYRKIAA